MVNVTINGLDKPVDIQGFENMSEAERGQAVEEVMQNFKTGQHKQQDTGTAENPVMNFLKAAGGVAASAFEAGSEAIQGGELDPQNRDLPEFTGGGNMTPEQMGAVNRAKVTRMSDQAYGERIADLLGGTLTKDESSGGNIIEFTDQKGNLRREVVNNPGLGYQDIDRFASQMIPFVLGGGAMGAFVRGMSVPVRAAGQAVGQYFSGAATDKFSGQEQDHLKNLVAGASGGVAESLLPAVRAVTRPLRNRGLLGKTEPAVLTERGRRAATRDVQNPDVRGQEALDFAKQADETALVDPAPRYLTDKGRKQIEKLGVNPDTLTPEAQQAYARMVKRDVPIAEALARSRALSSKVRMSKGQATGDTGQLNLENEMRTGHHGPDAEKIIKDFDNLQGEEISNASNDLQGAMSGESFREASAAETGGYVQDRLILNKMSDDLEIDRLYSEVGTLNADQSTRSTLPGVTNQALLGEVPNAGLHPNTTAALDILDKFRTGAPIDLPPALGGGQGPPLDFQSARRQIGQLFDGADPSDKRLLRRVQSSLDDWLQVSADAKMLDDPAAAGRFLEAKRFTAESKSKFLKQNKGDIAGGKIEDIMDLQGMDSPELVIRTIFGSGPKREPIKGAVNTINRLKKALTPQEFDVLKAGVWRKFTRDPETGLVLSPRKLDSAMKQFRNKQPTLFNSIFNKTDVKMQKEFMDMVRQTQVRDLNPSKSGIYLKTQQARRDNVIRFLLRRQGTRETFRGRPLRGSLYGSAARLAPNLAIRQSGGRAIAKEAIDPRALAPRTDAGALTGAAGGLGAQQDERIERNISGGIDNILQRLSR